MSAEEGVGLPMRLGQTRALLLEVAKTPGIIAILTTPAVPVREAQEDIMVMDLMAMPDGS